MLIKYQLQEVQPAAYMLALSVAVCAFTIAENVVTFGIGTVDDIPAFAMLQQTYQQFIKVFNSPALQYQVQ